MNYSFNVNKNSYVIDEALESNTQGIYLRNLIEGGFSTKVAIFLLLIVAFICLHFLMFSMGEKSMGMQEFTLFLGLSFGVLMLRFIEMKVLYRRLKGTFNSREEFINFLAALAYNRYTYAVGVDVTKELKGLELGASKTLFFLKYISILRYGKRLFSEEYAYAK